MRFECIPDKIACYRGLHIQCLKRLQLIRDTISLEFSAPLKQYHMQ